MTPDELKGLRKEIGARQQDLADVLGVSLRTIQNWEQPESSREHRAIPEDYEKKIHAVADIARDHKEKGRVYHSNVEWLQVPMRHEDVIELKRKADYLDIGLTTLIHKSLYKIIQMSFPDLDDKY